MHEDFRHSLAKLTVSTPVFKRLWIVSGGQTGVDSAAINFALKYNLPTRGWCPKGRLTEDGNAPLSFPLQESQSEDPALRTELNAHDSDGTLILTFEEVRDGTVLTEECAAAFKKPLLTFFINSEASDKDVEKFRLWIEENQIRILNIAGPRESFRPGVVYQQASKWLEAFFLKIAPE